MNTIQENTVESSTMLMPSALEDSFHSFYSGKLSAASAITDSSICPEVSVGVDYTCGASLFSLSINARRYESYCGHDRHDDCPLYLSKSLRLYSSAKND